MTALSSAARRVTVVTPRARVDVALPLESTLAELVPQLVRLSGADERGSAGVPGWSLSRLGGVPLEPALTVSGAGLRDGEVVYLRPREQYAAPLLFDDVIDAIASAAETGPGTWGPAIARRVGIGVAVLAFAGAAALLLPAVDSRSGASIALGALAVALLLGGGALGRAYGDAAAGAGCVAAGAVPALLAGMSALPDHHVWPPQGAPVAVGLSAVTVYGVLATVVAADLLALFAGLTVAAAFGAAVAAVVVVVPTRSVSACAVSVAVATALCALAPMLSLRLGRLPLPRVPTDVDAFRSDEDSTLGPDVLEQTVRAEQILTGLLAALAAVVVGCAAVLLRDPSRWAWTVAGLAAVIWIVRSRSYAAAVQRISMLGTGLVIAVLIGVRTAVSGNRTALLVAVAVAVVTGLGCLAYTRRISRGRRSPYWSRLTDVVEFLSLVSLLPAVGAVIGVYDAVRDLAG